MKLRTTIVGGLLAGVLSCLLVPAAATAADCPLPGSAGTGMTNVALNAQGDLNANRTGGYLQLPFTVPAGTTGIQVRYSYDQPGVTAHPSPNEPCSSAQGDPSNTLDMGVYQPKANPSSPAYEQTDRRGWSGSAVRNFAIAQNGFTDDSTYDTDKKAFVNGFTTRAYQPGPIQNGDWAVELGIAYIQPDSANDGNGIHYHVQVLTSTDSVWNSSPYAPSGPPAADTGQGAGWYTGDLHVHGEQEPGNATMTDTFAAAFGGGGGGLDFITLVDHNNSIAHNDMKTQADQYPNNLVIPGTEVTTYAGHWNNEGSSAFADFRGGPIYMASGTSPYDDADLTQVQASALPKDEFANAQSGGGWTQINHPSIFKTAPSACRGCFWGYSNDDTDFSKVDAIEIQTGPAAIPQPNPSAPNPFTADAIAFYEHALDSGAHVAAVGSSDDHKAGTANGPFDSAVGDEATAVYSADGLNKQGIIEAVKADHTYVKLFGTGGPDISLKANDSDGDQAIIGDSMTGENLSLEATVSGITATGRTGDWDLTLLQDGVAIDTTPISGDGITQNYDISESGRYSIEVNRTAAPNTFIEDYSTPIWLTAVPSNDFTAKKAKVNKKKGTAVLPIKVPGAGSLKLKGDSLASDTANPSKASTVDLDVKPTGKLKKKLKKKGKLTVKPSITFTPTGGDAATEKVTVKLVQKKKH